MKNKNDLTAHLPKKRKGEPKWFEGKITSESFITKKDWKGKFYAHHNEWKDKIWIGPYDSQEEVDKVIASYVAISKKPFGDRKELKNVHSIVIEKQEWV